MSHIETAKVIIKDLQALRAACERLGATLVEGQKTYKWYGFGNGGDTLPAEVPTDALGTCDHAIRVPGVEYEVGLYRKKDGSGYIPLYDFWGGPTRGGGLKDRFGNGLTKLVDAYSVETLKAQARRKGYMTRETVREDGKIQLQVTMP